MAAFIPAPATVRVEMRFTQQGQKVENVYNVLMTQEINVGNVQALAGVFASWWTTSMSDDVSTGLTLQSVVATDISVPDGLSIEHTEGLPASGLNASGQPPMNVTVAIKWITGLAGRSFRGRTYHLGIVNNQLANSTVNPSEVTTLHNLYQMLLTEVLTTTNHLAVVSKFHNKAPRDTAVVTPIIDVSVDDTTDSQRRRLPHRGQ